SFNVEAAEDSAAAAAAVLPLSNIQLYPSNTIAFDVKPDGFRKKCLPRTGTGIPSHPGRR
ncbi:MAG: hypothetical protein ACAH83_08390, partial [Alphaproteobacteria bacterium]